MSKENEPGDLGTKSAPSGGSLTSILAALVIGGIGIYGLGQLVRAPGSTTSSGVSTAQLATGTTSTPASSSFNDEQKKSIEQIVKNYLLSNPEIMLELQGALEAKMEKEQAEKLKKLVAENAKEIYRHPDAAVAGNPNGDITVVEFFDYNCGYCKRAFGDIAKLVEKDKNVRVVFAELPIIRDESEPVSRIALAARQQGKYWEMHRELISTKGLVSEAVAMKIAEKLGLDIAKLKTDMNSAEVKGEVERIKALAKKMNINGTPHFLVGDRSVGGAPEHLFELLEGHVTELRKSGCSYC